MKLTNTLRTFAIATPLALSAMTAQAEISGNVALATDYMFRGVSQTDNQMALQGGFDFSHDSGFYAGTWASNVAPSFFEGPTDPQIEWDLYAGFSGEIDDLGYDFGVIRYGYPSASDADTTEIYGSLSYSYFTAGLAYSDELNFVGVAESAWYFNLGAEFEMDSVTLAGSVGLSDGDAYSSTNLGTSYVDYSLGISTEVAGVGLDLSYIGTNDDGETIFGDVASDRVVFTVSKDL